MKQNLIDGMRSAKNFSDLCNELLIALERNLVTTCVPLTIDTTLQICYVANESGKVLKELNVFGDIEELFKAQGYTFAVRKD